MNGFESTPSASDASSAATRTLPVKKAMASSGCDWPQSLGHLQPVIGTEVDVEQNQRDRLARECVFDLRSALRLDDPVTVEAEVDAAEHPEGRIVVRDEYGRLAPPVHAVECSAGVAAV